MNIGKLNTGNRYVPIVISGEEKTIPDIIRSSFVTNSDQLDIPISALTRVEKQLDYKSITGRKEGVVVPVNIYNVGAVSYTHLLREVFLLNDTLLFGTEDYKACKHMLLNLKDSSINYIPQTINFSESYDPFPISQTISTYSPDKKYIASAYFNFHRIDFIDDKGEIFKIIFYKDYINPLSVNLSQESEEYFSAICSDQKYIYALYNRENIEQNEIKTNSSRCV